MESTGVQHVRSWNSMQAFTLRLCSGQIKKLQTGQERHIRCSVFPSTKCFLFGCVCLFVLCVSASLFPSFLAGFLCLLSLLVTLVSLLPCCISIFRRPSFSRFIVALAACSLSFFLFFLPGQSSNDCLWERGRQSSRSCLWPRFLSPFCFFVLFAILCFCCAFVFGISDSWEGDPLSPCAFDFVISSSSFAHFCVWNACYI